MNYAQALRKRLSRLSNLTVILDQVLVDRRLKVREIAETGILKVCVGHILHEILDMRKLLARWVPRLLTRLRQRRYTYYQQKFCLSFYVSYQRSPHLLHWHLRRYVLLLLRKKMTFV